MRVAIVYDRVNKWGGAERVLLALNEIFPKAPLFTSVYSNKHAKWADVFPIVVPSFLQKMPYLSTRHELLAPFMPLAFESHDLKRYDLVISVTSEAAKGVLTDKHQKHICYCLTPTRYLWSGESEYFRNKSLKKITSPLRTLLKRWDRVAAYRPDTMVSISTEVQKRIQKYYGRDSDIVFPPVDTKKFSLRNSKLKVVNEQLPKNYYLVVSRLVPYKKIDLVIETFNELETPLVIVGSGSEYKNLKRMAKGNVLFTGAVSDEELAFYYAQAKGLIFPQEEDFGIVSLEAQAMGIPVIAFAKGGVRDTVIPYKTGIFFDEQKSESLTNAIHLSSKIEFRKEDLRRNALRFSKERFKQNFLRKLP